MTQVWERLRSEHEEVPAWGDGITGAQSPEHRLAKIRGQGTLALTRLALNRATEQPRH